jgi:OmpA family protein
MAKTVDILFRDTLGKVSTFSHDTWEIILHKINVYILEFEDVLFHHNSAVMMPENPKGKSSAKDGKKGPGSQDQEQVSGVKALALVFKELEFDPEKRLLIAGHTDTTGKADYNFDLSALRARNVLYLQTGEREPWADVSYEKHKIEDYQQILTYYSDKYDCDPAGIDDSWGKNTKTATEKFIEKYNSEFVPKVKGTAPLPDGLVAKIENDGKKRWPRELWEAVFNLYSNDLREILDMKWEEFNTTRGGMKGMFLYDNKRYVACGESFPIDSAEKDNYRSQENRRVEILFFDRNEALPIEAFQPCKKTTKKHTDLECPLWNTWHIKQLYIDPNDIYALVYHLSFKYFDRVTNKLQDVPSGLSIQAFENDTEKLTTATKYQNGVYYVKVQFKKPFNDPSHKKLRFEFETADNWIYTEDDKKNAVIATKTKEEIAKLAFKDRLKYYDLPAKWSSRNYWTRYDGDLKKGDRFENVFKKLKPLGSDRSDAAKPLVFSLEDIVLASGDRSQVIQDQNSASPPSSINLDAHSRYTLFYIDDTASPAGYKEITGYKDDKGKIKLYNQDPDEPVFTKGSFAVNLITDVPGCTRVVYFCNGFYDVFDKRSSRADSGFDWAKNHIEGARMAILNDPDIHVGKEVHASIASDKTNAYAQDNCGNYELHYLNNCGVVNDKMLAYLLVFWSCRLKANLGGTVADVTNHRKEGMTNAMKRLNKDYLFEKSSGPAAIEFIIRPFHFMEAKNDTNGGSYKALVDVTDNTNGAWMMQTTAKFRARDYQDDPTYFGAGDPDNTLTDTDGSTYNVLTNHHEMGHATGNWDSYLYDYVRNKHAGGGHADWRDDETTWNNLPKYDQPYTAIGGPYSCDKLARMNINRTPRLRDFWKFVCWLHDEGAATKSLNKFTGNLQFKITFQAKGFTHNFELHSDYKNIERAAKHEDNHALTADAKADLHLYKLGDDETSHFKNLGKMSLSFETTQVFKGILVVRTKFAIRFINGAGTDVWTFNGAHDWAEDLNNQMKTMLNGKFRIKTGSGANDFSNIYVQFMPHFTVYTGTDPADSHINIRVTFRLGNNYTAAGNTLQVDWDTDKKRIIRYCFGKTTGTADLSKSDFGSIVTWVGSAAVANAAFTMENL